MVWIAWLPRKCNPYDKSSDFGNKKNKKVIKPREIIQDKFFMKSGVIPQKLKETLQQTTSPSYKHLKSPQGSAQKYFLSKKLNKNELNGNRNAFQNNFSVSTSGSNLENRSTSQISIVVAAMNYCLNTQSIMANAISEIAQSLLEMKEEQTSAATYARNQLIMPQTARVNLAINQISNKGKANTSKKCPLQLILSKFETLKKEITAKICELEGSLSAPESSDLTQSKLLNLQLDEFPKDTPQKAQTPVQKFCNLGIDKQIQGPHIQQIPPSQRFHTLPSDFESNYIDLLNDNSNKTKSFLDNLNQESRSFAQKDPSPIQNADKCSPPYHKKASLSIQGSSDATKETMKSIKPDVLLKAEAKPTGSEGKSGQINMSKLEKKVTIQASYQRNSKTPLHTRVVLNDRGDQQREKMNSSIRQRITSCGGFTKELDRSLGHKENSIKPAQIVLPQKQIMDDSFADNVVELSILEADNFEIIDDDYPKSVSFLKQQQGQYGSRERVHFATEGDEYFAKDTQEFIRNTASKEKTIIRNLMKKATGTDTSEGNLFLHYISSFICSGGGQEGNPLKKCLINAKWWRAWKDFVNFDAEEELTTKCIIIHHWYLRKNKYN